MYRWHFLFQSPFFIVTKWVSFMCQFFVVIVLFRPRCMAQGKFQWNRMDEFCVRVEIVLDQMDTFLLLSHRPPLVLTKVHSDKVCMPKRNGRSIQKKWYWPHWNAIVRMCAIVHYLQQFHLLCDTGTRRTQWKKSAWKPLKSYPSRLFFYFFLGECEWPGHKMW